MMNTLIAQLGTTYQQVSRKLAEPVQRAIVLVQNRISDTVPETYRLPAIRDGRATLYWLLIITLLNALGILCISYAFTRARQVGADVSTLLFPGLLLLFVPAAVRLLLPVTERTERIYLLSLVGVSLYLIKVLASPLYFSLFDEFLHMRTANDIALSGHLYSANSMLPVSAYYPGLEIVTNALSTLSGLDTFYAGTIIIGVARFIMILSLFLLYEQLLKSHRAASIATLVYITNPHFLMFDAEFSYESLAFPLTVLTLVVLIPYQSIAIRLKALGAQIETQAQQMGVLAQRIEIAQNLKADLVRIAGIAWFIIVAIAFTHHITSYFLDSLVLCWASIYVWMRIAPVYRAGLVRTFLFAICLSLLCLLWPGNPIVEYLSSFIGSTLAELRHILTGSGGARQLFTTYNDHPTPLWQRGLTISSFIIVLGCLPFGLLCVWRQRANALICVFGIIAFLYPVIQVFRFTNTGSELTDRAAAFLFLPLSYVLALFFVHFWPLQRLRWQHLLLITTLLTVMLCGGVILGAGPRLAIFPGPYEAIADNHSIEEQGIESAQWVYTHLPPNSRVATDRTNQILQLVYGQQHIVSGMETRLDISPIFLDQNFGPSEISLLQKAHIRYLIIDMRLTHSRPLLGFYYEQSEAGAYQHLKPIDAQSFEKFHAFRGIEAIFDSGDIIIYDMKELTDAIEKH
ncbi:MAG: hypothetical protein PVS3B1_17430 [Ktedonobacteraceae bacterium]